MCNVKHRAKSAVIPANKGTIRNYGWHEYVLNKLMLPKRLLLQNICFRCNLSSNSEIKICVVCNQALFQKWQLRTPRQVQHKWWLFKLPTRQNFFWQTGAEKRRVRPEASFWLRLPILQEYMMYPWEIARRSREPSRIHRYLPPFDLQYQTPSRLWQKLEHSSFCHRCEVLKIKRPWVGDRKTPCRSKPWPNYDDWAPKKVLW